MAETTDKAIDELHLGELVSIHHEYRLWWVRLAGEPPLCIGDYLRREDAEKVAGHWREAVHNLIAFAVDRALRTTTNYWQSRYDDAAARLVKVEAEAADLKGKVASLCLNREAYNIALMRFDPRYAGRDYLLAGIDVMERCKAAEAEAAALRERLESERQTVKAFADRLVQAGATEQDLRDQLAAARAGVNP